MSSYYNNSHISNRLKHAVDLLYRIQKIHEEEIFDENKDFVTVSLFEKLTEQMQNEIYTIFENIPADKDGVKTYTDKSAVVDVYNNTAIKYTYAYTGVFNTNHHNHPFALLLKPFDFENELDANTNIECDYKNIFAAIPSLTDEYRRYYNEKYTPYTNEDQMITHIPANMSMLLYNYVLSVAGVKKPTKSLSLIAVKNEITTLLDNISKSKDSLNDILAPRIKDTETKYFELVKEYIETNAKIKEICKDAGKEIWQISEVPKAKPYVDKFEKLADKIDSTKEEYKSLLRTAYGPIHTCFKIEQRLAAIFSYMMDQKIMHYAYKDRRKYSMEMQSNIHMIIDDTHKNNKYKIGTYAATKSQDMVCCRSYSYRNYEYNNTLKNNKIDKPIDKSDVGLIDTYYVPEFHIPYITKEDAEKMIELYVKNYATEAEKIHNNNNRNKKYNDKIINLVIAYYTSLSIHDLCEDPQNNPIKTLNLDVNDMLFTDKIIHVYNNDDKCIKVQRLLEDTYTLIPEFMCEKPSKYDYYGNVSKNVNYCTTEKNLKESFERLTCYNNSYNIAFDHAVDKLTDMLNIINMIQEQMLNISDTSFHNFLVKSELLDASLIAEPKKKKSTKTAKSKAKTDIINTNIVDIEIIDADDIEIVDVKEVPICE